MECSRRRLEDRAFGLSRRRLVGDHGLGWVLATEHEADLRFGLIERHKAGGMVVLGTGLGILEREARVGDFDLRFAVKEVMFTGYRQMVGDEDGFGHGGGMMMLRLFLGRLVMGAGL
ncbi:hypothetical protein M0R45_026321 [Rubus argutus]|uniref:Uncharacterized protein n=1 Tax=Rubus argutus TaxID=59490 RepID=A0AAW1WYV0_RUBAR